MLKLLIIFLIRKRLGLKRNEEFRFANQRSNEDYYFFTYDSLIKMEYVSDLYDVWWQSEQSHCSLNWLLSDDCKIVKVENDI